MGGFTMAIIPCRECAHQVSDQAASCPACGAPITFKAKTKSSARQRLSRALIALMALWTLGTLLWLVQPQWMRQELVTRARLTLRGFDHPNAAVETRKLQANTNTPARTTPVSTPPPPAPALRAVYRTTAEELYRAYMANAVATQSRIGGSLVRLNGSVAGIDQDDTGHPVIKLWTGKDSAAAMTLAADQRAAAAQLYKGEAVDVECDKIGGSDAVLEGSGCTLVFVDIRTREVNLALFLTNAGGGAHVYVVGPMPEAVCRAHSEEISSRLRVKQRGEHVVWRSCTDAGRESILPGGCRLNSPSVALPDLPSAHLWHYDCGPSNAARTVSHKSRREIPSEVLAAATDPATEEPAKEPAAEVSTIPSPAPQPAAPVASGNLRLASAGGGTDIGGPKGTPKSTTSDDLAQIRAVDPQAANHIARYCSKAIESPTNRDALVADCRRNEAAAWTRLVLQNEFPTLDEATRQKCSEPPFPDTYVAKETCARYELHAN
jgi:hypothetical protein